MIFTPEEKSFIQIALSMKILSPNQVSPLLERKKQIHQQGHLLSVPQILVHLKMIPPPTAAQIEQMVVHGYSFCSSCSYVHPQISPSQKMLCPQCKSPLQIQLGVEKKREDSSFQNTPPTQEDEVLLELSDPEILPQKVQPKSVPSYQILKLLGKGGYGQVFSIQDRLSHRSMALKVLDSRKPRPEMKKRFLREIQITSVLEHPNIIPVYESGILEDGSLYFVMKEIRGSTLKDLLGKEETPLRSMLEIFLKICDALDYAHSKGIIHRDLKPANIAVGDFGEVIVMDWGIAKYKGMEDDEDEENSEKALQKNVPPINGLTMEGAILGTPGYLSPEQAKGQKVDERSDIFGLGVILYEILTGGIPFDGNFQQRLVSTLMEKIEPPEKRAPEKNIPSEISAIAQKALEKDPQKRYNKVRHLKKDIQLFLDGYSVSAKKDSLWEKNLKWMRRNRGLTIGLGLGLLVFLLFLGGMGWWEKENRSRKVKEYWHQAEHFLSHSKPLSSRELAKEYGEDYGEEPAYLQRKREESLKLLVEGKTYLEKALEVEPSSLTIQSKLYEVEKEIGLLALLGRNYLLSRLSFERCLQLKNNSEGRILLKQLEEKKKRIEQIQLQHLKKIFQDLERSAPEEGLIQEYSIQIARMKGTAILEEILQHLQSSDKWQRLVAIQSLGFLGDNKTLWKGKVAGQWLMESLEKVNLSRDLDEAEALVWALGRLRETRANALVDQIRWKTGEGSLFWQRTNLPYRWIPLQRENSSTQNLREILDDGFMKYNKQDYKGALEAFHKALSMDPNSAEGYNKRGLVYFRLKNWKKALEDYSKAIQIAPNYALAYGNRGGALHFLKDYKGALEDYRKALELDPRNHEIYGNRAYAFLELGKYEEALQDINQALSIYHEYANGFNTRGMIYERMGLDGKAIEDFTTALKLEPDHPKAWCNRGSMFQKLGNIQQALDDYSQAILRNPQHEKAYLCRGMAFLSQNRWEEARKDLSQAAVLSPGDWKALSGLAAAYNNLNDFSKALETYNQALQIESREPEIYFNRALVKINLKDTKGALEDLSQAIQLNSKFANAYRTRAMLYQGMGEHRKAALDAREYLKLDPKGPIPPWLPEYIRKYGGE